MKKLKNYIQGIHEGITIKQFSDDDITFSLDDFMEDEKQLTTILIQDPKTRAYAYVLQHTINSDNASVVLDTNGDEDNPIPNPVYAQCKDYLTKNCTILCKCKPSYDSTVILWQLKHSFFIVVDYTDQGGSFFIVPENGNLD